MGQRILLLLFRARNAQVYGYYKKIHASVTPLCRESGSIKTAQVQQTEAAPGRFHFWEGTALGDAE